MSLIRIVLAAWMLAVGLAIMLAWGLGGHRPLPDAQALMAFAIFLASSTVFAAALAFAAQAAAGIRAPRRMRPASQLDAGGLLLVALVLLLAAFDAALRQAFPAEAGVLAAAMAHAVPAVDRALACGPGDARAQLLAAAWIAALLYAAALFSRLGLHAALVRLRFEAERGLSPASRAGIVGGVALALVWMVYLGQGMPEPACGEAGLWTRLAAIAGPLATAHMAVAALASALALARARP